MKQFQFLLLISTLGLSDSPTWALRQPATVESSGLEELHQGFLSAGMEEQPPFGRWLKSQRDEERVYEIVQEYKGRAYPSAKKKGPREHGTKKTLRALMEASYYVRFYTLGVRDYFVFPRDKWGPFVVWAEGQQVGRVESLTLGPEEVDYPHLEPLLGKRLRWIYLASHPYERLRELSRWLSEGLSVVAAARMATAKDFLEAKR